MTARPDREHQPECVVYCVLGTDDVEHACWCPEGALSFVEFANRHPNWARETAAEWLDSDEGRQWQADVQAQRA